MEANPTGVLTKATRSRVAFVAALCLFLALGYWIVRDGIDASKPSHVVLLPDRRGASAPVSNEAPMRAASAILSASAHDDEIQVCGGEWLRLGADGNVSETDGVAFARRSLGAARTPTLAAMESSPDERARAAAQFVEMGDADASMTQAHRDALARLAQGSTDPQVYAWAYQACGWSVSAGPCQLINAEQWARLDPSNAMPWLVIAGNAEKLHDASALDDAMFHMANAERQDTRWGALTATVLDHVPPGDAFLPGAFSLEIEATGMEAARAIPYQTVTRYCAVDNVADANRRQTCEAIAELFVTRSTTFLDFGIGAGLGRRVLDWPEERIKSLDDERTALSGALPRAAAESDDDVSCHRFRRDIDFARDVGRYGELGALRRTVAASGKSMSQLAAERRKSMREDSERLRQQEAASAASPASSPNQ